MDYYNASIDFGIIRRRVQSLVVEATMDLGLTYSEFSLMLMLYDKEGCSQDDMTSFLHVDKAAITRVIKKMEQNGYLYRKQDSTDRRLKRLYLTDKGKKNEKIIKEIVDRITNYLFSDELTEMEKDIVAKCLHHMAQKLGKADYSTVFVNRGGK